MNWRKTASVVLVVTLVCLSVGSFIAVVIFVVNGSEYCVTLTGAGTCHSEDKEPYRLYGTKTAYHTILTNTSDDKFHFKGCEPKVFYLLSRHATRYPDRDNIEKMMVELSLLQAKIIEAYNEGKSGLCKTDIERLKLWALKFVPDDDNRISKNGQQEASDLAKRYKRRFPTILAREFKPNDFQFEYTTRERTFTTATAFASGLFGTNRSIHFVGDYNDRVLQFHKTCQNHEKKCNASKSHLVELDKFEKGPFMKSLVNDISERLGFQVSHDEIGVMREVCGVAYALLEDDIWCSVFSKDDLKVLEYEGDLDDYYKDSYGRALNYEQACPVVDYLVKLFRSSREEMKEKAVLQFSHAGALKRVYPLLGLYRDTIPFTATNFCKQQNRQWRSSYISSFNTNLAIVLYACGKEPKLAAFHNEKPIILNPCEDLLCPIDTFLKAYHNISENCNLKSMCCSCCIQ